MPFNLKYAARLATPALEYLGHGRAVAARLAAPALEYLGQTKIVRAVAPYTPAAWQFVVDSSALIAGGAFLASTHYVRLSGKKNNNEWRKHTATLWTIGHWTNITIGGTFVALKYGGLAFKKLPLASGFASWLAEKSGAVTRLKPLGIAFLFAGTIPSLIASFTDKVKVDAPIANGKPDKNNPFAVASITNFGLPQFNFVKPNLISEAKLDPVHQAAIPSKTPEVVNAPIVQHKIIAEPLPKPIPVKADTTLAVQGNIQDAPALPNSELRLTPSPDQNFTWNSSSAPIEPPVDSSSFKPIVAVSDTALSTVTNIVPQIQQPVRPVKKLVSQKVVAPLRETAPYVNAAPPIALTEPTPVQAVKPDIYVSRIRPFGIVKSAVFFIGTGVTFLFMRQKLSPKTMTSVETALFKGYEQAFGKFGAHALSTKAPVYASNLMLGAQAFQLADSFKENDGNIRSATWYGAAAVIAVRFIIK